jgi:hypothetical protein
VQGQLVEVAHCVLVPRQEYQQHSRYAPAVLLLMCYYSQTVGSAALPCDPVAALMHGCTCYLQQCTVWAASGAESECRSYLINLVAVIALVVIYSMRVRS